MGRDSANRRACGSHGRAAKPVSSSDGAVGRADAHPNAPRRSGPDKGQQFMLSSLSAIVPMACVAVAGIAAMTAEAFRAPGERIPIAPLGAIGLIGAGIASLFLWGRHATSYGVVTADNFGLFVTCVLIVVGLLSLALSPPT